MFLLQIFSCSQPSKTYFRLNALAYQPLTLHCGILVLTTIMCLFCPHRTLLPFLFHLPQSSLRFRCSHKVVRHWFMLYLCRQLVLSKIPYGKLPHILALNCSCKKVHCLFVIIFIYLFFLLLLSDYHYYYAFRIFVI